MVRIGIHTADASRRGDNYSGVGVHIAARVAAAEDGTAIVATTDALDEAAGFAFSEPRETTVRGVAEPIKVASIAWS